MGIAYNQRLVGDCQPAVHQPHLTRLDGIAHRRKRNKRVAKTGLNQLHQCGYRTDMMRLADRETEPAVKLFKDQMGL
ncbi:hypothetical protein D3C76_1265060 [compost metagenome]